MRRPVYYLGPLVLAYAFEWRERHRRPRRFVLKQWGNRFWFGFGTQSAKTKLVERAWLKTVFPPYLEGSGIAVRLPGYRSVRLGICRAIGVYVEDEYDTVDVEGELDALGWHLLDRTTEVIGSWRSSEPEPSRTTPQEQ